MGFVLKIIDDQHTAQRDNGYQQHDNNNIPVQNGITG
jgi:hypothetical protein